MRSFWFVDGMVVDVNLVCRLVVLIFGGWLWVEYFLILIRSYYDLSSMWIVRIFRLMELMLIEDLRRY